MYLLFTGMHYYPCGGWSDYRGRFESVEQAIEFVRNLPFTWEWAQIVDSSRCEVVWEE